MLQTDKKFTNSLLAGLPQDIHDQIVSRSEVRKLDFNSCLYEAGSAIDEVYFPESGVVSLIAGDDRISLEVGMLGRDGMVGLALFLGVPTAKYRAMVQGAGSAICISASDVRELWKSGGELSERLLLFTHSLLNQVTQSAVCVRFHEVEARLARWLLTMQDLIDSNEFALTQDFLSSMLGVRREAVNKSARVLQDMNLISYLRGTIMITDRMGLERASCSCYAAVRGAVARSAGSS